MAIERYAEETERGRPTASRVAPPRNHLEIIITHEERC